MKKRKKLSLGEAFYALAAETVSRLADLWMGALLVFWSDVWRDIGLFFPFRMPDFPASLIDHLGKFLTAVANAPGNAIRASLLHQLAPAPKGWSWQVLPMERAYLSVAEFLLITVPAEFQGNFPLSVSISNFFNRWGKIFGKGRLRTLLNFLPTIFRVTWIKVIQLVVRIVMALIAAVASWAGIIFCAIWVLSCHGSAPPLESLQQETKRKRVALEGGGSLLRREPGGSPP